MSFNDLKIPRKAGIIRRFLAEKKRHALFPGEREKALNMQYAEYTDLCYYSFEEPMEKEAWLNQIIKPIQE